MTYIDYLNGFNRWLEHNYLPLAAQVLYYRILDLFNRTGWPETVQVDNLRMMCMIQSDSKHTLMRSRDALITAGFLEYQKGRKGSPGKYKLGKGCFLCAVSSTEKSTENGNLFDTENSTTNSTHIKTKTKNIYTPYSPPKDDAFDTFWSAYPRKVGKEKARTSFRAAIKKTTLEIMLSAIEMQNRSDQWRRDGGQYIPHPSTWLNQGRWEDEVAERGRQDGSERLVTLADIRRS